MSRVQVPSVYAAGRWSSSDLIASMAGAWRVAIDDHLGGDASLCVASLPPTPEGLALFAAASARRAPVAVVSHDPEFWPSALPLFAGTPLFLPPSSAPLANEARRRGFVPVVLGESVAAANAPIVPLQTEGFVIQSSGSTGAPKSVFRPTAHLIAGVTARNTALGLRAGDGLIGSVPLASGQGVVQVVAAMVLGGPLGLLGSVDHREALTAIARPEFKCWRVTPQFADVLGRCSLQGAAVAPPVCLISSPVPRTVFDVFQRRFGAPLRGTYSSTEMGAVAVDAAAADHVRHGTVGCPLPGVDVHIGDHLHQPVEPGTVGRIWVRSAWQMAGYGVPPALERPGDIDGWWPSEDLGALDAEGWLTLSGRADQAVRTREGRLVNLEAVAHRLRDIEGVRGAIVLPVDGSAGSSFGAVIECAAGATLESMRELMATGLPAWARPRRILIVLELPRLPNGKPNRLACLALLGSQQAGV